MRWKSPSERVQAWLITPLLLPFIPFAFLLLVIIWLEEQKSRLIGPDTKSWRAWFAWYPVKLGYLFDEDRRWVWLEIVERKRRDIDRTEYRGRP